MKNLSNRELTQPEKDVLVRWLNFAVAPEQIPVVDLITAVESAIRNNKQADTETVEQLQLNVSAAFAQPKAHPSNLTTEERKALASLKRDRKTPIL